MCKKTIENAVDVDGVISGKWNMDTKMMSVVYDTAKTDLQFIQRLVAKAGYDNEGFKADNDSYNNLHFCCQYERE